MPLSLIAQSTDQNYILTRTYQTSDGTSYLDQIQYFDGLGRPVETVQKAISGVTSSDLVRLTEYDGVGREYRHWLPITNSGSGAYVTPTTITGNTTSLYGGDARPYATTNFEHSPLNRVTGKYGAGASWYTGKKNDSILYQANIASEVAFYFVNTSNQLQRNGYYAANTLYKTIVIDEDGKTVTEFKDKLDRLVMKRNSTNVDTYFVYNDLGQLSYVLPPLAADALASDGTFNDNTTTALTQYAYLYKYDERGNNVVKRRPGCDSILMVYDKSDRLILSQDGNQRLKKQWSVTKYDALGRVLYTGYLTRDQKRTDLKAILDPLVITESYDGSATFANTGYTCGYFVSEITPLLVNYYDSYKFRRLLSATDSTSLKYVTTTGFDAQYAEDKVKGLLTGTRTYILNQKTTSFLEKVSYLTNAFYYDVYGRVVQTRGTNHLAGYECGYNHYDFTGRLLMNKKTHGPLTTTEITRNEYNNAGRLIKVRYKIDAKDTVTLAQYSYDELGRPIQKLRHNGTDTETFGYNIRNWPTQIYSGAFHENLYYNTSQSGATPTYNGNISYQTWTYGTLTRGYQYYYDELNRLQNASSTYDEATDHLDPTAGNETYTYDKMGNVKTLYRVGLTGDVIDNLTLTYTGNQLQSATDAAGSQGSYSVKEYQNRVNTSIEMAYDPNGNLIKDLDRDIVTIRYNSLNLPDTIQFKTGNQIINRYTASGQKIRTEYFTRLTALAAPLTEGNTIQQSYTYGIVDQTGSAYIDNMEYKTTNGSGYSKVRIYNSEGYATALGYLNYYRKDHLGNNREVWQAGYTGITAGTMQSTQYYPSGLPWAEGTGTSVQSKKYNDKEFIEMHGYDTYDYGARSMYPALGDGFMSVDPLAEKHYNISPYVYCAGNPVNLIDPDGMDWYKDKDGTTQYNPDLNKDNQKDILGKDQSYVGETYQEKDDDGNITTDYRKDGSIMYTNETDAYKRMWSQAHRHYKDQKEVGGVTLKNGDVLVLPDYKNDKRTMGIEEYGYSLSRFKITDGDNNTYSITGLIHTHQDKSGDATPSGERDGDLGVSRKMGGLPIMTIGHDGFIYGINDMNPKGTIVCGVINMGNMTRVSLLKGTIKLTPWLSTYPTKKK